MATEADTPELIHEVETEETKDLGCSQFDKTLLKASSSEMQRVEDEQTLAPEIIQSSAKAEEPRVIQYATDEHANPANEGKVGISEGEIFLESPSVAKASVQDISQVSEDSSKKETPSLKEKDTLKNKKLQEHQPNESVEVKESLTEGNKADAFSKQVPLDMNWEDVKKEEEQPAKSSESLTEEKTDESVEVTDGLTDGEKADTFDKQVPLNMNLENVQPEDEQLEKSTELLTEKKEIGHIRTDLFSSPIPTALVIPDLQELETLSGENEVSKEEKQNATEFPNNEQAAIEENLQKGDITHPHLLKSSEAKYDEAMLEAIHVSEHIEEGKAVNNLQRHEMDEKKSREDLNLEAKNENPQRVEATLGHDCDKQSQKTDVVVGGESENMKKSIKLDSCIKEESIDNNLDIKSEPIELDVSEINDREEELESKRQEQSFELASMQTGLETMSQTEDKKNEGNENPQDNHGNSSAAASTNIQNGEAEKIENDESTSDKLDTPVTMVMEETGHERAETQESEITEYSMTYSLDQRSKEITEKETNDECSLEDEIQDENKNNTGIIEKNESRDDQDPENSQQREKSVLAKLERSPEAMTGAPETAILSSNDKVEAYKQDNRPAENLEKSFKENNCNDNREDGVQKEENSNQVDSVDKIEQKEVESPKKCTDDMPITFPLVEKSEQEECEKHKKISKIEVEEEIHKNNGEEEKEQNLESVKVSKTESTANIEHDKEGTPAMKLIQTSEKVSVRLEIAAAGEETRKQNIVEEVVTSHVQKSTEEETVNEHSQEVEVSESFKAGREGEPAEKQVIEDVAAPGISKISVEEEAVKENSKDDEIMSYEVPERLDRNSSGEEAEKQEMKDVAAAGLSTVLAEEETSNMSSQEDEKAAKKHKEEVKEPEEASREIIFEEATDSTERTGMMTLINEEKTYNNDNVLNVKEHTEEETIQKEGSEKLANASFLVSEISKEQLKEHILESDQKTNYKPDPACITSTPEQTSLRESKQEGKAGEESKRDIPESASVAVPESEGQVIEKIVDSEITHTKTAADNKAEGESLESSILASKEQELKFTKENETIKGVRLLEDEAPDNHQETHSIEQLEEELSMRKEEPENLNEANKIGCEDDKENPNKEFQKAGESFQNIETVNAVQKDVSPQSSQESTSEVKSLRDASLLSEGLATAASSASVEDNTGLKEMGSFENLEESLEEGRRSDEGKYTDATSKTKTQTAEVIIFPDGVTMEQNFKASELSEEIESITLKNQADDLSICQIPAEETVKAVIEKNEKVSYGKPEEHIHKGDGGPLDVEEHTLEMTKTSKATETASTEHGKSTDVMTSELIQTSETECMELTNINELGSKDKLKDTDTDENIEDMTRSEEQTTNTDLHERGTEDGTTEEGVIEEDRSIKDHNMVILRHERVESSHKYEKDQNIVEKPVDELQEKDHMCETIDAEYSKMNAIQKEEVDDKIIKASDNTDNIKEEICAVKDISIISIGGETINESPEEDKKEELNPGREVTVVIEVTGPRTEVHESLKMTGPSTDKEQETIKDHDNIKDHSERWTEEEAVTQTYLEDEKEVKILEKEVCTEPETAGRGDIIIKQIIEEDDTVKARCTLSTGEGTIKKHSQEEENEEKKPKIEVFQELVKSGVDKDMSEQMIECDDVTDPLTAAIPEEAIRTRSDKEEVVSNINLKFNGHEQIEATNEHEAHGKQSIEVDPTVEEYEEGEPGVKYNSLEDEVHDRFKPTSEGQDSGLQILDDEAITDFNMTLDQTNTEKPKEDEEAKKLGEVKEYELPSTEDFKVTDTVEEKDKLTSKDGEASNKNHSAFSSVMPLGEELIQKESSQKFSESEEHIKEEILEKADNTNKACPSAYNTIATEKLSLQVSEPEGQKQVEVSILAHYETSSALIEASETVSTSLNIEAMKPEETLNLDEHVTNETPIAGKSDAYKDEEEKLPVGASTQDQKITATSGIVITDTNLYFSDESEKVQESSSMLVSEKQELRSINMYSEIKDATPLRHEIQDEKQEAYSAMQIKEEITMQAEEPRKLKDGVSEVTGKESLLPDSDLEEHISKSKDNDAVLDMEITAELTESSEDRQLDNSSQRKEKNQSGGELELNQLSKEIEKADTCTSSGKDNQENVENHTKSHGHSFTDEKDEHNDIECIAEAATKDHVCESRDTAAQNFEPSVIGEKPNSCIESVNEGHGHEKLSIPEEVGKIIKDWGTASVEFQNEVRESKALDETGPDLKVEDRMINDAYQHMETRELVSEGIEKVSENVMVEKQIVEEERNAKHLLEDETSNEESSLLVSRKQELGSIDMNKETPLEHEIQDDKLETASTAHIKEEITMQAEEPRKLKKGESEDTEKESPLPESDHEEQISKSKDTDAVLDPEKTVELTDLSKDRQLEKNQSEGELELHQLSKEIEKADACANIEKQNHDQSFKREKYESNNVEYMAEAETKDHGCQSCDTTTTITTSNTKDNDAAAQNFEASEVGEKPKSCVESVAEDKHHEKLSITEEVGKNIKDWETSSFEDKMRGQSFQNELRDSKNLDEVGPEFEAEDRTINDVYQHTENHKLVSEGSEKVSENDMVERQIIEEERNDKHLVEDETSNEAQSTDIASPIRTFEATDATEKKEIDTLGEECLKTKPEASPVAEVSEQDILREEDFEKLSQVSSLMSKSSEGKDIEDCNVYELDMLSVTEVAKEANLQEAEPKGETILEASDVDYEKKRVETFETIESSTKGENDESAKLQISTSVSQLSKFDENTDQENLTVETMDKDDVGTTEEKQKDTQKKEEQIKNIDEVHNAGSKADELGLYNTTENESSKDENVEAVNLGENMKITHIESQEKFASEVLITNSLTEGNLVGDAETNCEEAPNNEPEKLQEALDSVSQSHLQVIDVITKDTGNEEDESMVKAYDTLTDRCAVNSFQKDENLDRQLKEEEPTIEAEENQNEIIDKGNENIQKEIVTEEVSNELQSAITKENTAQQISEGEEDVKDPRLILGVERVNECNEEGKNKGEKVAGAASKTKPEEQIHELEVDKVQIEKTHEAKDIISHEEVQREPENTGANESIEQQITVDEGSVRDPCFVTVEEEIVQKSHQEEKMNKEEDKIAPVELKPEEPSVKLESEEDKDMKVNETIIQEKENINKEIKEVSEGLETAGASEKITMLIVEEKEALQNPYPMHVQEEKVKEIQKEDFKTPDVEDEAPKLNSEYHNQDERNDTAENEEINSPGPVIEVHESQTAGSIRKTELVTVKDDEDVSRKLDDPPNGNSSSEEVTGEVSKELEELSEVVHEEPINEKIITKEPITETASEDTDAVKGGIELDKIKNASDVECGSTGKTEDLHIQEEIRISDPDATFRTENKQQKLPEIEGNITESNKRQDLASGGKEIAEVIPTAEGREDNSKNEASVEETLQNEAGTPDIKYEEQQNQISEQEEAPRNIELLKKPSDVTDEEHTARAADFAEITDTKTSTGTTDIPSKPGDPTEKSSKEAKVEDEIPGEASRIESEEKGLECGDKRVQDEREQPITDSKPVSLSDLMQKSTKETFKIVRAEEKDPLPKHVETENIETPSMPREEQKAREEDKDEDGEEEDNEHNKTIDSGSDAPVMVDASRDIDMKPPHKKSHNLLSGMRTKVKHSIAKVKKVITGSSSHHKPSSPK